MRGLRRRSSSGFLNGRGFFDWVGLLGSMELCIADWLKGSIGSLLSMVFGMDICL